MKKVLRREWKKIDGAWYYQHPKILDTNATEEDMIEETEQGWKLSRRIRNGVCLGGTSLYRTPEEAMWAVD